MKQQRTLHQALQLTAEQRSFIQPARRVNETPESSENVAREPQDKSDAKSRPYTNSAPIPEIVDHAPTALTPLTTRLHPQTAEQLRRAYLQRKLDRVSPSTQQEIVEEALRQWLHANGFGST